MDDDEYETKYQVVGSGETTNHKMNIGVVE